MTDVPYCNEQRPHQGIKQQIPVTRQSTQSEQERAGRVEALPVLGGLHHAYRRVASSALSKGADERSGQHRGPR